jgi:NAD-dependent deacetylase
MRLAESDPAILSAARLIRDSHHLVFFSGAGISTPSGVPDFRSPATGLWEREDPMEVASLSTFHSRPERFYTWLRPLAERISQASPTPAHTSIAELQRAGYGEGVITQNIDGLHQRRGSYPVFELHGTLHTISCPRCEKTYPAQPALSLFISSGTIPICPQCGAVLKPDIVLFEEALPWDTW